MGFGSDFSGPAYIFGTLAAAAALKFLFGAYARWRKAQRFELVGRVAVINVFPVKSCTGFSVEAAWCSRLGMKVHGVTDRHWMITRPNGDFITQRQIPKMALIKTSIHGTFLHLDAPGMSTLKVPVNPPLDRSKVMKCRVFDWITEGMECGEEAGTWVSKVMEQEGLKFLFSAPGLAKRDCLVEKKPWGNPALPGDQSAFSDFCAYLVLSEQSVAYLNTKLSNPVTIRNFRPSIVISVDKAFDEDNWQEIRIGEEAYMRMLDPCTRCQLTTVNPERGEKYKDGEPLKTLKTFRCFPKYGESPIFGVNGAIDTEGPVKVGDPVYALRK